MVKKGKKIKSKGKKDKKNKSQKSQKVKGQKGERDLGGDLILLDTLSFPANISPTLHTVQFGEFCD